MDDSRSGAVLLALAPWFVFASSAVEWVAYAARALLLLTAVYLWGCSRGRGSAGITLCILGMLGVGALGADLSASTWIAVAQLAVLWTVVSRHRVVESSPGLRSRLALSFLLFAAAAVVVAMKKPGPLDTFSGAPSIEDLPAFAGPFGNPNALGLVGVAMALWSFLVGWRWAPLACCGLVVLSGSRTSLVSLLVFTVTYFGATRLRSKRFLGAAVAAVLLAVPAVTAAFTAYGADVAEAADEPLLEKSVLTGRQIIWPIVLAQVSEHPLTGYGLGHVPGDDFPDHYEGLSAHNGFLQVLYQGGAIALALYTCLFIMLAKRALSLDEPKWRAAAVGVLCAAVVCETFEVLLTQNHFGIGIGFWILASTTITPSRSCTSGRCTCSLPRRAPTAGLSFQERR